MVPFTSLATLLFCGSKIYLIVVPSGNLTSCNAPRVLYEYVVVPCGVVFSTKYPSSSYLYDLSPYFSKPSSRLYVPLYLFVILLLNVCFKRVVVILASTLLPLASYPYSSTTLLLLPPPFLKSYEF